MVLRQPLQHSTTTATASTPTNKVAPLLPINLGTINQFFGAAYCRLRPALIEQQAAEIGRTATLRRKRSARIGRPLYDAFIAGHGQAVADRPARAGRSRVRPCIHLRESPSVTAEVCPRLRSVDRDRRDHPRISVHTGAFLHESRKPHGWPGACRLHGRSTATSAGELFSAHPILRLEAVDALTTRVARS